MAIVLTMAHWRRKVCFDLCQDMCVAFGELAMKGSDPSCWLLKGDSIADKMLQWMQWYCWVTKSEAKFR
jgi:hypothetical protein